MANSSARSIHWDMQQQATISSVQQHEFTVSLFTTHRVPKEVRHWQIITDASSAETTEIGNRNKLVGKHELQPMSRLEPKANSHTTTNTNCGSQSELTPYSFHPYLTIPVRSSTCGRLMPPARSRWPIAVLIPSIEICNNKPQSVPLNTISFTVPLFTTHSVPKEERHWQMATGESSAGTTEIGNRNKLVGKATCNRCQG